ncbi:hypothetical protein [Chitinimonas sp. BJB300]|uniref:hypothetical protein n=1 Tax=Chitinimonas sp. BJB300 TaxID=1559339 RepID=UPI001111C73B|nr:hypothetical protein [Chitinimonas sp. BJB300]TSJ85232.1 hypothetical protein FG002_018200 [Chitinimonas sp. BJB300]
MQCALNPYLRQLHTHCRRLKVDWTNLAIDALQAIDLRTGWPEALLAYIGLGQPAGVDASAFSLETDVDP